MVTGHYHQQMLTIGNLGEADVRMILCFLIVSVRVTMFSVTSTMPTFLEEVLSILPPLVSISMPQQEYQLVFFQRLHRQSAKGSLTF